MDDARVVAVMYHYVRDRAGTRDAGVHGLDTAAFHRQLDLLCDAMEPVTWPMLYAWLCGRKSIAERGFLLTFDDGLSDHAEVVAPILEERGLRGVFFVPGRTLQTGRMHSAHQAHFLQSAMGDRWFAEAVHDWLDRHQAEARWPERVDIAAAREVYHYEDSAERACLKFLLAFTLPIDLRDEMIDDLLAQNVSDPCALAQRWNLDPQQLIQLHKAGHTIGGHGYAHQPYLRMDAAQQEADLQLSANVLASILGPDTRPFSFPYGSVDDAVARRCAEAGFAQAFTTRPGWITPRQDAFQLNRVDTIAVKAFVEHELLCPAH